MRERVELLKLLIDADVLSILKTRLGAEGIADLVMEAVNPHWELTTERKAKLGSVSTRTVQRRSEGPGK